MDDLFTARTIDMPGIMTDSGDASAVPFPENPDDVTFGFCTGKSWSLADNIRSGVEGRLSALPGVSEIRWMGSADFAKKFITDVRDRLDLYVHRNGVILVNIEKFYRLRPVMRIEFFNRLVSSIHIQLMSPTIIFSWTVDGDPDGYRMTRCQYSPYTCRINPGDRNYSFTRANCTSGICGRQDGSEDVMLFHDAMYHIAIRKFGLPDDERLMKPQRDE